MTTAQLRLSRALWRAREIRAYRSWDFARHKSRLPEAERKQKIKLAWAKYSNAKDIRLTRDHQIAAKAGASVSAACVEMVAEFEGFRGAPYRDAVGVWTIGYGETSNVGPNTPHITQIQAKALLKRRLDEFGHGVQSLLKRKPTQRQYDALVSFSYNVGLGGLGGSTLLRKYNAGDIKGAGEEFLKWDKAGGRALPGLTRRRREERLLFLGK